jgi:hypothetical protein
MRSHGTGSVKGKLEEERGYIIILRNTFSKPRKYILQNTWFYSHPRISCLPLVTLDIPGHYVVTVFLKRRSLDIGIIKLE